MSREGFEKLICIVQQLTRKAQTLKMQSVERMLGNNTEMQAGSFVSQHDVFKFKFKSSTYR
jgi:hypothetical protein